MVVVISTRPALSQCLREAKAPVEASAIIESLQPEWLSRELFPADMSSLPELQDSLVMWEDIS